MGSPILMDQQQEVSIIQPFNCSRKYLNPFIVLTHRSVYQCFVQCYVHLHNAMFTYLMLCTPTLCYVHLPNTMYTYLMLCIPTLSYVHLPNTMYTYLMLCTPTLSYVHLPNTMYTYLMPCTPPNGARSINDVQSEDKQ